VGSEPWSGQTKDNKMGVSRFCVKPTYLMTNIKDWLAWYQDNVSEWSDMFAMQTIVLKNYKNPTKHVGLVQSGPPSSFY